MLASEFAHHHTGLPVGQACRGTVLHQPNPTKGIPVLMTQLGVSCEQRSKQAYEGNIELHRRRRSCSDSIIWIGFPSVICATGISCSRVYFITGSGIYLTMRRSSLPTPSHLLGSSNWRPKWLRCVQSSPKRSTSSLSFRRSLSTQKNYLGPPKSALGTP